MGADETSAVLVQITREANALSGTLDEISMAHPGATTTTPSHAAFTGTLDGNALTLSFPQGFGLVRNISGTVSGSSMSLQVPQDDGAIASLPLKPGSLKSYNQAVEAVQASAQANASANEAAAASAAAAASLQESQQRIASAGDAVLKKMKDVRAGLATPPSFSDLDNHLSAARDHLADAQANAAEADRESDQSVACSDAYTADSDAYTVESDAYTIDSDMLSLTSEIDSLKDAAADLNRTLTEYQQAAAALPDYTPPQAPDANQVKDLLNQVSLKTAAWRKKGSGYQSKVAKLLKQARAVAEQAKKEHC
ncbi:hypothetical protein [Micromonospora sp. NPDC005299]|uniref:hypothetical protein n=1 Tax=Micromonospora sp. NPDC005299 TaxID=3364231 RepID=UPI0036A27ED5